MGLPSAEAKQGLGTLPPPRQVTPHQTLKGVLLALTSSTRTAGVIPPALLNAQGKLRSPAPKADFSRIKTAPAEERLGLSDSKVGLASKLILSLANSSMSETERTAGCFTGLVEDSSRY